jgi:hypothetical protein
MDPRGPAPGRIGVTILVGVVAVLQAAAIAIFVFFALTGDSWGIARAMALLLSVPFVVLTVPALLLLKTGWPRSAGLVAVLSAATTWLAWHFA